MKGSQVPRLRISPDGREELADTAIELAALYGLVLDPWQQYVLRRGMRVEAESDMWSASRVGLSVPRQNGKSALLVARELAALLLVPEEQLVIHSAHLVGTALEGFRNIKALFENYDDLGKRVKRIREANGEQGIEMMDGARLLFRARARGNVRGMSPQLLILDEAQILPDEAWSSMLPSVSAQINSQIWLTGTPPGPNDPGEVFSRVRKSAISGNDSRVAWLEWSVDGDIAVEDRRLWAKANPAMGIRIHVDTVEDELNSMDETTFARERLGMFASDRQLAVIPGDVWASRKVDEVPPVRVSAIGIDMAPDAARVSVAVGLRTDAGVHVELADVSAASDSTDALVEWIVSRARTRVPVLIDALSPARLLIPVLKSRKVKVVVMSGGELMEATSGFYTAAKEGTLTHFGQEQVTDSLAGARRKAIGDAGGWKWDRKSMNVDLTPIVAVTNAHYGVVKFAPKRVAPSDDRVGRKVVGRKPVSRGGVAVA